MSAAAVVKQCGFGAARLRRAALCAFTLVELLVAVALIGITTSGTFWALTRGNTSASIARLQTGAFTAAQNRIDLILSNGPFVPQKGRIPPELTLKKTKELNVPIYTDVDPVTKLPRVSVVGTRETEVVDLSSLPGCKNLYGASVTVSYRYGSRDYSVTLVTLRASDI